MKMVNALAFVLAFSALSSASAATRCTADVMSDLSATVNAAAAELSSGYTAEGSFSSASEEQLFDLINSEIRRAQNLNCPKAFIRQLIDARPE